MTEPPPSDLAEARTADPNPDRRPAALHSDVVDLPCVPMSSRCAAPATPHVWVSVYQFTRPRFPRLPDESRAGSCRSAGAGRSVALAAAAAAAAAAAVGPNADCHLRCALTISARRHVLRVPRHHTQPLPHGQPLRPRAFSAPEELGALPATSLCPPPTVFCAAGSSVASAAARRCHAFALAPFCAAGSARFRRHRCALAK